MSGAQGNAQCKSPTDDNKSDHIPHTLTEWMDGCGGREKEREVQIERKGRAEVREFNEICGFCSDTRQVKNNGTTPTTRIMMLHLIYSGVQKSETTSEKLFLINAT